MAFRRGGSLRFPMKRSPRENSTPMGRYVTSFVNRCFSEDAFTMNKISFVMFHHISDIRYIVHANIIFPTLYFIFRILSLYQIFHISCFIYQILYIQFPIYIYTYTFHHGIDSHLRDLSNPLPLHEALTRLCVANGWQ